MKKLLLISCFLFAAGMAKALLPIHEWARGALGGTSASESYGTSVAVDAFGNVYTAGIITGTMEYAPGVSLTVANGGFTTFITKHNSTGTLQWVKQFEITNTSGNIFQPPSLAVDAVGNVYTTGSFEGTIDFNPDPSFSNTLTSVSPEDIFISKLNSSGIFIDIKRIGNSNNCVADHIKLDAAGNIYITGRFSGPLDFDPNAGIANLNNTGCFFAKYTSAINYVWAKEIRQNTIADNARGTTIAIDASNNVYVGGFFNGTIDINPGAPFTSLVSSGVNSTFFAKYNSSGTYIWGKKITGHIHGGYGSDFQLGLDGLGFLYLSGSFAGPTIFNQSAPVTFTPNGPIDIFVAKYNATSGGAIWARQMGGPGEDYASGIAVDGGGNVYTTGGFSQTADFDPSAGIYNLSTLSGGLYVDIFVSKLNATGHFIWAAQMQGASNSFSNGYSIAADAGENIYTTGIIQGEIDFDPSASVNVLSSLSPSTFSFHNCVFVHKLSKAPKQSLDLTLLIEGFYLGGGLMQPVRFNQGCIPLSTLSETDLIDVELRNAAFPHNVVSGGTCTAMLRADGRASCAFPTLAGGAYYIFVKHRNAIATCSWDLINIGSSPTVFNFTTGANQAWGSPFTCPSPIPNASYQQQRNVEFSNTAFPNGLWAFYSGDISPQDENIDNLDESAISWIIPTFPFGCFAEDLDGDADVNLLDEPIVTIKIPCFIFSQHPW